MSEVQTFLDGKVTLHNPTSSADAARTRHVEGVKFQNFMLDVFKEVLRVLKPGGHLLAFSGTRTYHRMACAIEDAGFEIRDQIGWAYGSGFPKSHDVSKAIDKAAGAERQKIAIGAPVKRMIPGADQNGGGSWIKDNGRVYQPGKEVPATAEAAQWDGWGTALKPAWEPIVMLHAGECHTLFITGPRVREWGFWCPHGWRHWKDFTAGKNGETIGRGCE